VPTIQQSDNAGRPVHLSLYEFVPGLTAAAVDHSLRECLASAERAQECAIMWFSEVARRKLYHDLGFPSLEIYAAESLGFSRNRACQFIRLSGDLERLPRLREAVAQGQLGWTKAQQVARVATPASEKAWVDRASQVGRRELATEVKLVRARAKARRKELMHRRALTNSPPVPGEPITLERPLQSDLAGDPPTFISLRLDGEQLARFEGLIERVRKLRLVPRHADRSEILLTALAVLADSTNGIDNGCKTDEAEAGDHVKMRRRKRRNQLSPVQIVLRHCPTCNQSFAITNRGEKLLSAAHADAMHCDARVSGPDKPNRSTIKPSVRAEVLARDRYRCTTPGCGASRFLSLHHIKPRIEGGSNLPENLVTLCSRCHRFLHERHRKEMQTSNEKGESPITSRAQCLPQIVRPDNERP
jgi:hypothetical protein